MISDDRGQGLILWDGVELGDASFDVFSFSPLKVWGYT